MIPHILIIDDEEDVLESLVPGFIAELAQLVRSDEKFRRINESADNPLPASGRLNIAISSAGYQSSKLEKYTALSPTHLRIHLCCEKGGSFRHALRLLKENFVAVVVSDLRFSDDAVGIRAGQFFIEDLFRRNPESFGILYSAYQKPASFPADRFLRKGAGKQSAGSELAAKIVEGLGAYFAAPTIQRLTKELKRRGIVYQSDAFGSVVRRLYDFARLYFVDEGEAVPTRRSPRPMVLLDGETGTGKTELAGLLHAVSDRRSAPFVSATCSQLADENLLRSTLFGHVKGAYSGAQTDRAGLVQAAGRGILLLDDLHRLSEGGSVILHSFLDDGEYSHLGEDEIRRHARAAIIAAVETPKWEEIKAGEALPESFIHRVEQLVLRIPPLRSRPEDIAVQAAAYCAWHARQVGQAMELAPEAVAWLVDYGFPGGNSRKLRDFLRGVIVANASVTDYIGVAELEAYAAEIGITGYARERKPLGESPPAAAPTSARAAEPSKPTPAGAPSEVEASAWSNRVMALAGRALADGAAYSDEEARAICRQLFDDEFQKLWSAFVGTVQSPRLKKSMEIKLFDELLRYFAVYRSGNPAKAARELGMKDNALREFIYSREQKRERS